MLFTILEQYYSNKVVISCKLKSASSKFITLQFKIYMNKCISYFYYNTQIHNGIELINYKVFKNGVPMTHCHNKKNTL